MRTVTSLLLLVVLVCGAFAIASAHEDPADQTLLEDRIKSLEQQVGYLRGREAALTAYVLRNQERADGLEALARRARAAGFEARSIAVDSRRILLEGLEQLAGSLRRDLPVLTREEQALLKQLGAAAGAPGR